MSHLLQRPIFASALVLSACMFVPNFATVAQAANLAEEISFDDITFEMKKGGKFERAMLGSKIEALDGRRVRIRGYILPSFKQQGIKQFVLVRDNMACCFGPGAALFDAIIVEMAPGKTATFTVRPVAVEGTFAIKEVRSGGKHLAIYSLTAEEVK